MQRPISQFRRIHLPRLSEKGSEGGFEGGFGPYEEAEMGPKEPSRWSVGPRKGCFQGFSDSLSTLDFSHLRAKGIDTLLIPMPQKR
jgi:hypothetical protein